MPERELRVSLSTKATWACSAAPRSRMPGPFESTASATRGSPVPSSAISSNRSRVRAGRLSRRGQRGLDLLQRSRKGWPLRRLGAIATVFGRVARCVPHIALKAAPFASGAVCYQWERGRTRLNCARSKTDWCGGDQFGPSLSSCHGAKRSGPDASPSKFGTRFLQRLFCHR